MQLLVCTKTQLLMQKTDEKLTLIHDKTKFDKSGEASDLLTYTTL